MELALALALSLALIGATFSACDDLRTCVSRFADIFMKKRQPIATAVDSKEVTCDEIMGDLSSSFFSLKDNFNFNLLVEVLPRVATCYATGSLVAGLDCTVQIHSLSGIVYSYSYSFSS